MTTTNDQHVRSAVTFASSIHHDEETDTLTYVGDPNQQGA